MSRFLHKSHNVSVLLYHLVCPTKYRRSILSAEVDAVLRSVCLEIADRYEMEFLEIGTDNDHVHFLIQSVPTMSRSTIACRVKSLTAWEVFARVPALKRWLWGGAFWSSGYFLNSVGRHGSEEAIRRYVGERGVESEYSQLYLGQLGLLEE